MTASGQRRAQFTRAQQRELQKLADKVGLITQVDRLFFERFSCRQHRLRIAAAAEIEQETILRGALYRPPGSCIYVVVKNVAPGVRLRLLVCGAEGENTDMDEAAAREIFESAAPRDTWMVETEMRRLAEGRT